MVIKPRHVKVLCGDGRVLYLDCSVVTGIYIYGKMAWSYLNIHTVPVSWVCIML